MSDGVTVSYEKDGPVAIVAIERPEARNAVNRATAPRVGRRLSPF